MFLLTTPIFCLKNPSSHIKIKTIRHKKYVYRTFNYSFYTAHKKEAIARKFSTENLFWKNSRITVQHEQSATWKERHTKKQHQNSAQASKFHGNHLTTLITLSGCPKLQVLWIRRKFKTQQHCLGFMSNSVFF